MPAHLANLLHHVRRLSITPEADSDTELLRRFARDRDDDAFGTLVARHGSMVFNCCRRVLGDADEADDACQAMFTVFARRASSVRRPDARGPGEGHVRRADALPQSREKSLAAMGRNRYLSQSHCGSRRRFVSARPCAVLRSSAHEGHWRLLLARPDRCVSTPDTDGDHINRALRPRKRPP